MTVFDFDLSHELSSHICGLAPATAVAIREATD